MNNNSDLFIETFVGLKEDEGFSPTVYKCTAGKWTIGYGRNVDPDGGKGLLESEAQVLLANDITEYEDDLKRVFPAWDSFSLRRKSALLNLRFQLGPARFRGFRKMIAAIEVGDWDKASAELIDSSVQHQTPRRNSRRANELKQG